MARYSAPLALHRGRRSGETTAMAWVREGDPLVIRCLIRFGATVGMAVALLVPQAAAATHSTYLSAQAQPPQSRVTRVVIDRREPIDNVDTGASGAYEKLVGKAFLEADPNDPHNTVITDIGTAPRNGRGL